MQTNSNRPRPDDKYVDLSRIALWCGSNVWNWGFGVPDCRCMPV